MVATVRGMTAKEQLHRTVDELTETEAAETLNFLSRRRGGDALGELLAHAPLDDEPVSDEEEQAVEVARDEIKRGETVSLEQVRTELR